LIITQTFDTLDNESFSFGQILKLYPKGFFTLWAY